ncbi:MAG: DUF58 domain-containing protein [Desulfobacteraceae bacterium]|jgi:uncharacterized protein (DUF58 family)
MPETQRHKYLRSEDIRRLGSYEFAPKALAEGYLSGRHRSRQRGASVEFHDFRAYTPGDDPALIDWRVYGRTDRHYLKTFEQETNLECHVFLDSSGSMAFGEKIDKLTYASFFCAALCYLVIKGTDRISLTLFDDTIRQFHPPGSTGLHMHKLMQALEQNTPGNETRVSEALRRSLPLLKRRATLIIISDFLDEPASIFEALSPYLHKGFKVHLIQILDPEELKLQRQGAFTFVDLETQKRVPANTGTIRYAYQRVMRDHIDALRDMAARRGVQHILASTDTDYFKLFDFLSR